MISRVLLLLGLLMGAAWAPLVLAQAWDPSQHRIGVRVVNGAGELYDKTSGKPFVVRGNNYIKLAPQLEPGGATIVYHALFNVGAYDRSQVELDLGSMQASGYNTIRVFLNQLAMGNSAGGLSAPFMDNVDDFLRRAMAHEIYVILIADFTPSTPEYSNMLYAECCALIENAFNLTFLTAGGLNANRLFWQTFVAELKARSTPLASILAYELTNEGSFYADAKPLSSASGLVKTGNGKTYDMSSATSKQLMMDENLVYWNDNVRSAILDSDPTALVANSFLVPQSPNPDRIGDTRVLDTRPAIVDSKLDIIGLHPYPGGALTLPQYVENYGLPTKSQKIIMMGEFGAGTLDISSRTRAAAVLQRWQVDSCSLGFSGWLLWTWDVEVQSGANFWSAVGGDGILNRALSPLTRPDPCKAGAYAGENVALQATATASGSIAGSEPQKAIDGLPQTIWNSGGFSPQWIDIRLAVPTIVTGVRLTTQQAPFIDLTVHNLYIQVQNGPFQLVTQFNGITQDHQVLSWDAVPPMAGVTAIRVETVQSPSWVAWQEIEILSGASTTVASSMNPSVVGVPVVFTATIVGSAPTGTVSFTDSGAIVAGCAAVPLTGSGNARSAACTIGTLTSGSHAIVASYVGDSSNAPSAAGVVEIVRPALPGIGTIIGNPYGPLSVQGATLTGNTISDLQPNVLIQLGSTPGIQNSFAEIDFQGLNLGPGNTLTIRSGAATQTIVLSDIGGSSSAIAGALQVQAGGGAQPPALYLENPNGTTVYAGGSVIGPTGLTFDTLGATATTGQFLLNNGVVDGGSNLWLRGARVNGGGAFKGNTITISTFGNANNPVNGGHFLSNGLQLFPSSGTDVALTLNGYGASPQVLNVKVNGNAIVSMPSAWPNGTTLPTNNAPVPMGGSRAAGAPEPTFGGGSMIVQATGSLSLANGPTQDFVFPGGIVLKAGGDINLNGVLVNQGWTTAGKPFQGVYFESPNIVSSSNIQVLSNNLNWVNFSTFPHAPVRVWDLTTLSNGSAAYLIADSIAPHLNTYSVLAEAAANGQCWTCLVNTQPVNMYGP